MKYLIYFRNVIIYFLVVYSCLFFLVSLAAYNVHKANTPPGTQIDEVDEDWISGASFEEKGGVAKTIFGNVVISYINHCYSKAQSYFNATLLITFAFMGAIVLGASAVIFFILFLFRKKVTLSLKKSLLIGVILTLVVFAGLEIYLYTSRDEYSTDKTIFSIFYPICF